MKTVVARWETKGKDWLELHYTQGSGFTYNASNGGGSLPKLETNQEAIEYMERPWGQYGAGPVTVLKTDRPSLKRVI